MHQSPFLQGLRPNLAGEFTTLPGLYNSQLGRSSSCAWKCFMGCVTWYKWRLVDWSMDASPTS